VSLRGRRPGGALRSGLLAALALLVGACGTAATSTKTTVTLVPGTGGIVTVGLDAAPNGCNPNAGGVRTWATETVLAPVLPSAFVVNEKGLTVLNQ
jgi:hypothetical protein